MLANRDKRTIAVAVVIFLCSQTVIFASIPRDSGHSARPIVIKSGSGVDDIARILKKEGLIYSETLFMVSSLLYRGRLMAGEYAIRPDMSTLDIVMKMGKGKRNIYTLRIIEGHNIYTIAQSIEKSGIMTGKEFLALAADRKYLDRLGVAGDSLEGYLYPDTYFYSKEIDRDKFIERIVRRTLRFFEADEIKERMAALNMDMTKTLTLASMIEKESGTGQERPLVSAVFHNRLRKGMSFDCDPTVIYGTKGFGSPITRTDLRTYTPYNTYTFKGYPKGPICSPSKASMLAALNPADADYLFFVSRNDGTHVFSRDMAEHNRYVEMYQRTRTTQ